jgi:hypothetical protein
MPTDIPPEVLRHPQHPLEAILAEELLVAAIGLGFMGVFRRLRAMLWMAIP